MQCVVGVEVLYDIQTSSSSSPDEMEPGKKKFKAYPCYDTIYISIEIIEGNAYLN